MQKKPTTTSSSVPILLIKSKEWKKFLAAQTPEIVRWLETNRFTGESGTHIILPGKQTRFLVVIADEPNLWALAALPQSLPSGTYHLEKEIDAKTADTVLLGWLLGSYRFARYKKSNKSFAILTPPSKCNRAAVEYIAGALCHARDLINTPANDMGPAELASAAKKMALRHKAQYREIVDKDLLKENYPAIYTVGQASSRAPRLVDIRWGNARHPKVTLVGKGVCFDSGGLDIKTSAGMKLMKKDMGGAACVLALADLIMHFSLPVCLRVLIPAVENSIAGNAYRPSDIIATRKGMTVEVGNTDAEGRLILCDALYEADQEKPDLLIDCATLTGAARTALGGDIPAFFTPDDDLATDLQRHSMNEHDALWRLPLWQGYRDMLNSPIADINSAPDSGYAGAITAALYLREFTLNTNSWLHIDMMAWNLAKRPGRPAGGEAMAVRALFAYLQERYVPLQNTGSQKKK